MSYSLIFKKILDEVKREKPNNLRRPKVGWTCTYLPLEILEAGDLSPFRILPEATTEKADSYLDPNFCPFLKASLERALSGGYSFLSGIIFLNSCDGMRRLFDAWRFYCKPSFSYLLDLPRIINPSSIRFFREALEELIERLNLYFGIKITEERLLSAIERSNRTRALIKDLFSLQGKGDPPITHGDLLDILSEGWRVDRSSFNLALESFLNEVGEGGEIPPRSPKLMVTGSLLDGTALIRLIEELGGEVVASDLCIGLRVLESVPLDSDPLSSLSQAYLEKPPCARMHDTERRIQGLKQKLIESETQGLIYVSLKFCDPYLYEVPAIEEAIKGIGVPMLFLEGEYTGKIGGATRTRIQAFIEVLKRDDR